MNPASPTRSSSRHRGAALRVASLATLCLVAVLGQPALHAAVPSDGPAFSALPAEERWALLRADLDRDAAADAAWIPFLVAERDWTCLEWLALAHELRPALDALANADAPCWPRLAYFAVCDHTDSHSKERSEQHLAGAMLGLDDAPAGQELPVVPQNRLEQAHAWLHAQAPSIRGSATAGRILAAHQRRGVDASHLEPAGRALAAAFLPALIDDELFAVLSLAAKHGSAAVASASAPAGTDTSATRHPQVRRALDILVRTRRADPVRIAQVVALAHAHDHDLQRFAFLTAAWLRPQDIPRAPLRAVIHAGDVPPLSTAIPATAPGLPVALLQSALIAYAATRESDVDLILLRFVPHRDESLARLAISLCCQYGDSFVLAELESHLAGRNDAKLQADLARFGERVARTPIDTSHVIRRAAQAIGLASTSAATSGTSSANPQNTLAPRLTAWTHAHLVAALKKPKSTATRDALLFIATDPKTDPVARRLAQSVLDAVP